MKKLNRSQITRRGFLKASAGVAAVAAMGSWLPAGTRNVFAKATAKKEVVDGFCDACLYKKCGAKFTLENGIVTGVEGSRDHPINKGTLCVRGQAQLMQLYNPYRVKAPVKRTNPKKSLDSDPGWVEISWEEAFDITTKKIAPVLKEDPRRFLFFSGFGAFHGMTVNAFPVACGTPNAIAPTGCMCSVHSADEILHSAFISLTDSVYNRFVMEIGKSGFNCGHSDGEARDQVRAIVEDGAYQVKVDAKCSNLLGKGEWVPIKPNTVLPFALAMEYLLLHELIFDVEFVKTRTNGPFLIGPNGHSMRDAATQKAIVWDPVDQTAKVWDDPGIKDQALDGAYDVNGVFARPALSLMKEGVKSCTPEWAEKICTIPAATIRRLTERLVKEARIGSTILIDGIRMPYRPVCVTTDRGAANHRDGHGVVFVTRVLNILLGAWDVPGSNLGLGWRYEGLIQPDTGYPKIFHRSPQPPFEYPLNRLDLAGFMPMAFSTAYWALETGVEPEKYGINYKPEAAMSWGQNLYTKAGGPEKIHRLLSSIPFMATISTHFDEHTHYADVVFPESNRLEIDYCNAVTHEFIRPGTVAQIDGPWNCRPAVSKRIYDGRPGDDIIMELAARLKIQPKFNGIMSAAHKIKMEPGKKYTVRELYDMKIKAAAGEEWSFEKISRSGGFLARKRKESDIYLWNKLPKVRYPIYHEFLLKEGEELLKKCEQNGITLPAGKDAVEKYMRAVPLWAPGPEVGPKGDFDLNVVGWRTPQFLTDIGQNCGNPLLQEVALTCDPYYGKLILNPQTCRRKGLKDGDMVFVENRFGAKIGPVPVKSSNIIHPDGAGIASGMSRRGIHMNPVHKGGGISWNALLSVDWSVVDPVTGAIELSPLVKITKA